MPKRMSDSISTATSLVGMSSAATQQSLGLEMVKQNAQAEQSVVDLLQKGADQAKALLPVGQGAQVDLFA